MGILDRSDQPPSMCSACGRRFDGDPDDDPWHPGGPVCGACTRARADNELMWAMEAAGRDEDDW